MGTSCDTRSPSVHAEFSVDREAGIVAWSTQDKDVGTHEITLRVADAFGAVAFQSFQLEVKPRQPLRITSQPPLRVAFNTALDYQITFSQNDRHRRFDSNSPRAQATLE